MICCKKKAIAGEKNSVGKFESKVQSSGKLQQVIAVLTYKEARNLSGADLQGDKTFQKFKWC